MRKVLKTVSVFAIILSIFFITGCGKNDKSIVGVWNYYDGTKTRNDIAYKFNKDKTGSYSYYGAEREFTYEDDGKKVTIKYKGDTMASDFEYSIEKNTLTIKDSFGSDVIYKRK